MSTSSDTILKFNDITVKLSKVSNYNQSFNCCLNQSCFKRLDGIDLIKLNIINEGDYEFIPIDLNSNQSFDNCLKQNINNVKKPKIKDNDTKRLTRKNLNNNHFNDNMSYRKSMNKVESWLNDYPKTGVLYPYFDLSDEKNR